MALAEARDGDAGAGEVRPAGQAEECDRLIGPEIENNADAVGIDYIEVEGVIDRIGQLVDLVGLQQTLHENESPCAGMVVGFQSVAEQVEAIGKYPLLQRAKSKPPGLRSSNDR